MTTNTKKDLKIAIIGAGAAGLTAAEELKNRGYTNITIFEKAAQAGGKCCSIEYQGRFYELGAGIITSGYFTILKLVKKYGIPIKRVDYFSRKSIDWNDQMGQKMKSPGNLRNQIALFYETFFLYRKLLRRYQNINQPGLANVDPELTIPFSTWAQQHQIPHLAKMFSYFFTAFGYGYFDEIPAAYVLKYYSWPMIKPFFTKKVYYLPKGIQHLWTTIATKHHVIYEAAITKIERDQRVKITFKTSPAPQTLQTLEFDRLIIASPLDETPQFLDVTSEEKSLFAKIQSYDYRTYALVLKNFPQRGGFFPKNFTRARLGYPIFWNLQYPDSNFFAFYSIASDKINDQQALKNIATAIHQIGGEIIETGAIRHWKYFPHVTPTDLKNGFFNQLESLQGQLHTYFAGEIMNFSTVELTAEYAKKLIERFFL